MNINFTNKTALVCGSTQGIGFAIAQAIAEADGKVILVARNEDKLAQVKAGLKNQGHHQYLAADFNDQSSIDQLISKIQSLHIDILINNTGGPAAGPASLAKPEEFVQAFQMHLINNHRITTALLPHMKKNNFGRIINIISTSVKQPLPNLGVSNTIRAAVANWAKTLASEVAEFGITVNNVLPGATLTQRLESIIQNKATKLDTHPEKVSEEMIKEIPMKRFGLAQEIANAAIFLASDHASYITGINVPVDGGRTACL